MISTRAAAAIVGCSAMSLQRMAAAHPGLPGGPVRVGVGQRRRLRWDPDALLGWLREVEAAIERREPGPKSKRTRRQVDRPAPRRGGRRSLLAEVTR